jgi:hypothetical protein
MSSFPRPASAGNLREQAALSRAFVGRQHLPSLEIVCAWCGRTIKASGSSTVPRKDKRRAISHGICSVCSATEMAELSACCAVTTPLQQRKN